MTRDDLTATEVRSLVAHMSAGDLDGLLAEVERVCVRMLAPNCIPPAVQEAHHDLDSDPLERFDIDMAVHGAFVP